MSKVYYIVSREKGADSPAANGLFDQNGTLHTWADTGQHTRLSEEQTVSLVAKLLNDKSDWGPIQITKCGSHRVR